MRLSVAAPADHDRLGRWFVVKAARQVADRRGPADRNPSART
jgi:hypothetical protein